MRQISSKENSVIKGAKSLIQKKHRDKESLLPIEGYVLLEEAIQCKMFVEYALFSESFLLSEAARCLAGRLEEQKILVYTLPDSLFMTVSDTKSPQGVFAAVRKPDFGDRAAFSEGSNILVLDRLQDPGNVGTMIRTAEAAGFEAIICLKGTVDVYSPKVIRSAAGSILRMPIFFYEEPEAVLLALKRAGKHTVAAMPEAKIEYHQAPVFSNAAILVGNEASGLCEAFEEKADYPVRIPMRGKVESLNAAMAAGIIMYESLRGRK